MKQIFIDSSMLVSACISKTGPSAFILGYCRKGKIRGFISRYVLAETRKNVGKKLDQQMKQRLNAYLLQARLVIVEDPTAAEIKAYAQVIKPKDAPILAAAIKSKAAYLLTKDTTDFKREAVRTFVKPLRIMTPHEFVTAVLSAKV